MRPPFGVLPGSVEEGRVIPECGIGVFPEAMALGDLQISLVDYQPAVLFIPHVGLSGGKKVCQDNHLRL